MELTSPINADLGLILIFYNTLDHFIYFKTVVLYIILQLIYIYINIQIIKIKTIKKF